MQPLVSLVVPTRNRPHLLGELVGSLRAQTLDAWEAVIVDDGSDADRWSETEALVSTDPRLRLLRRDGEPRGAPRCRNTGVRAARAGLVVFFDDDDLLSPGCLAARVAALRDRPELDFAVFPYRPFHAAPGDAPGAARARPADALDAYLRLEPPWHTGGPVWRRSFLSRVGEWDERLASWQDWDFGIRALALRPSWAWLDAPPFHVRLPSARHRTISAAGWEPRNVHSWATAVRSVQARLGEAGVLDAPRRARLALLELFVAERLVEIGEIAAAETFWSTGVAAGLLTPAQHATARALLRGARHRLLRPFVHRLVRRAVRSNRLAGALTPRR